MQFVRYADTPLQRRGVNHRVGAFEFKDLGQGRPGDPANFYLRMVTSHGDFFSPRHLHNFDQVRVQLRGAFSFAEDGVMQPGCIGYFPEGTPYGPQTSAEDTMQLVMQLGGPGGSGYVGEEERVADVAALARVGRFERGRYFGPDDRGASGVDSFEAVWEYALKRPVRYPSARLAKPLLAYPEAWVWSAIDGWPAARCKTLWDFGPRTVACRIVALDAGAALETLDALGARGPRTWFVQSGAGVLRGYGCAGGRAADYAAFDAWHPRQAEAVRIEASEDSVFLVLSHPRFPPDAGIASALSTSAGATA
jgi:hypothetical protein